MKNSTKLAGAAVACAALCAVSILPILLAGGGFAALAGSAFGTEAAVIATIAAAGAVLLWRSRAARLRVKSDCGCGNAGGGAEGDAPSCTLPSR